MAEDTTTLKGREGDEDSTDQGVDDDADIDAATEMKQAADEGEDDTEAEALAKADLKEREAAKKERMELLAAQKKDLDDIPPEAADQRFQYLIAQSDVFAHFLAGEYERSSSFFCFL